MWEFQLPILDGYYWWKQHTGYQWVGGLVLIVVRESGWMCPDGKRRGPEPHQLWLPKLTAGDPPTMWARDLILNGEA